MSDKQIELPEPYLNWLATLPSEHFVTYKKTEWYFYSIAELQEPMQVDKFTATNATQLSAWVEFHKSVGEDSASGPKNTKFPFGRLANCIAVASYDTDILFTDPNDAFSMWKFQQEDVDVRPLKCDLVTFIESAEVEDLNDDDDD
jgi:hypothetical protein